MRLQMEDNIFERMAKNYDSESRIELANIVASRVKKELMEAKNKTLIDYGSGTGLIGLQLTDLVNSITLIDSSEGMVEIIRDKIAQTNIQNARTLVADFTKDVSATKADIILVSLVLLHIPDTKLILERLYGTLNDGGKLIIVDFDKNERIDHPTVHNGFDANELKKWLASTGFESTDIDIFYHGEKVFMKQDADMFIAVSYK